MKLFATILFALSTAAFLIGVHLTINTNSIVENYWIFMVSFMLFLLFKYVKKKVS